MEDYTTQKGQPVEKNQQEMQHPYQTLVESTKYLFKQTVEPGRKNTLSGVEPV